MKKLVGLGLTVAVETGAGAARRHVGRRFQAAGAEIAADAAAALAGAGIVFAVQPPAAEQRALIPRGALLVCIAGAFGDPDLVPSLAEAGIDAAAMELLPRITRAQSMDVLSSQANLAGYRAVIEGAAAFERGFPMMMTAAGTVPPARVFVVGAGVAGLQAIATARRLGAIVSATDVRPAAKEEIKSLGATFVGVEDEETAGADRRLRQGNERRVPPEAGRADGHHGGQERHRHHHRPGDGPQGAGDRHRADGGEHEGRQRGRRPRRRCRRQLRADRARREHHHAERRAHPGLAQLARPHRGRRRAACMRATC